MNKIAGLFAGLLFVTTVGFSQPADEKQIGTEVENLRKAMIAADKSALDNLTALELSYGHSNGMIENKQAFIEDLLSGKSIFTSIELTDQSIKISGDVAIVRHHLIAVTNNDHIAGKADLFVLLIWQKQKGEWKLLARQAVKNPAPAN
jgi:ketosteroid isomerase-like protein